MRDKAIETAIQHDEIPLTWKWAFVAVVLLTMGLVIAVGVAVLT